MYQVVVGLVTALVTIQMMYRVSKFKIFVTEIVSILVSDLVFVLYCTPIIY